MPMHCACHFPPLSTRQSAAEAFSAFYQQKQQPQTVLNPFKTLTNMTVDIVMSVSVMPMRAFVTPRDPTTSAAATDTATRP